ncbi:hypothetical protein BDV39DRAFT_206406 [Aspergillus sergii]|uniref:F-box domain-containing protein n=1 Tax=Aspergillus sergii TaxID=1034303 RepID=A0A5N6X363_9EURO|nr:hypothetical protein BDV39DRAFT_206406 [Aspergillus sergii]
MFRTELQKAKPVRQTYLASSGRKCLTIFDRDKPDPQKAFILRLPLEILAHIINLIASDANHSPDNHRTWKQLSVVCRRLTPIVLPLLYRHLKIETGPPNRSLRQLHRTLQSNPALGDHCRKLRIHISYFKPAADSDFFVVKDLIPCLTKVQILTIPGGFDSSHKSAWSLLQYAFQHIHAVRSLNIHREMGGRFLRDFIEHMDIPSLEKLSLSGVYRQTTSTEAYALLQPKKYRTATFTSLELTDYEESPEATKQLITWPKSLVHFHLGTFYDNPFYIDLPMLSEWLAIHKDTLKSIDIGSLSRGGGRRLFNACDFPKLEVLTLSRWHLAGWRPHHDEGLTFSPLHADLLLGASLHTFTLDFTVYDQHSEGWTDFGEREEHWVRQVAKAAIARKAALRKIKIIFNPDYWDSTEEQGYPWDRMDRIRDEIQPHGLVLEYSEPALTKEEWLRRLRDDSCAPSVTESLEALEMAYSERTYEGGDIREYFPRV